MKHKHVPTGEVRHCAAKGCTTTWSVSCHNHTRKHCDPCRQGKARGQARERMRAYRLRKQTQAEEQLGQFGKVLSDARELARQRLAGEITKEELAARVRAMSNRDSQDDDSPLWDDDDYR